MSETRTAHAVFPGMINHQTLFGGEVLALMDSAAFITATHHCRRKVVTAHTDAIDFRAPVLVGVIAECVARVVSTGRSSMTVTALLIDSELWGEQLPSAGRTLSCRVRFVLVALDGAGRPTPVPALEVAA